MSDFDETDDLDVVTTSEATAHPAPEDSAESKAARKSERKPGANARSDLLNARFAVRREVLTLIKHHWNGFGNYSFASIDQFYEDVVPIAHKHGINWVCHLSNPRRGDNPKEFIIEVSVNVTYKGGFEFERYQTFPMLCSMRAAQDTGAVMSQAEKVFMRSVFKIPTGEKDADAHDNKRGHDPNRANRQRRAAEGQKEYAERHARQNAPLPRAEPERRASSRPPHEEEPPLGAYASDGAQRPVDTGSRPPQPASRPENRPDNRSTDQAGSQTEREDAHFEQGIYQKMRLTASVEGLDKGWRQERARLDRIKVENPARYDRIVAAFGKRRRELDPDGKYVRPKNSGRPQNQDAQGRRVLTEHRVPLKDERYPRAVPPTF